MCRVTQGAQAGARRRPGGAGWGGRFLAEGICDSLCSFTLFYGRNQHNTVKQLSSIRNIFFKERIRLFI